MAFKVGQITNRDINETQRNQLPLKIVDHKDEILDVPIVVNDYLGLETKDLLSSNYWIECTFPAGVGPIQGYIKGVSLNDESFIKSFGQFNIPQNDNEQYVFGFILNNNIKFKEIFFQTEDYSYFDAIETENDEDFNFYATYQELDNLVEEYNNICKIGIQAKPKTVMAINGEEIHIGKSGVYEVKHGSITFDDISIITPGKYIIDFMYEEKEES